MSERAGPAFPPGQPLALPERSRMPPVEVDSGLVVAVESFAAALGRKAEDGEITVLAGQTILPQDHPVVKRCPHFFEPVRANQ